MKLFYTFSIIGIFGFATLPINAQWQALPDAPPIPTDNPQTAAKIKLGKVLFLDPRLSSTGTVSCNSCHNVMAGGEDNRPNAMGVHGKTGGRSAPTVWNSAFLSVQFWDGRAPSLEEQARGPVTNPIEMGMTDWDAVVTRLKTIAGYETMFKAAFEGNDPITADNAVKAIAAYERTLITPNSPYDRYVKGDKTVLTEQQVKGMDTFSQLGCSSCHLGPNFSGPPLPMGKGFFMKFPTFSGSEYETQYKLTEDMGRYEATKNEADKHFWRVPTLRNIALTAPYFHNGAVPTLDEAVRVMAKTQLNKKLSNTQIEDIVAFLNALTGEFPEQTMPRLPGTPGKSVISSD
ncbi:cytochrome-c peroxidase [Candidatus Parabeggiatoa sp. HSG14]|uniref:cytochrome-c peroxidase n=1 Tax=Candidatus Parabeggiatoa sp. HSG14 TaxID=3055593 RepID=UPI0025A83650|nr:cytochrome-c peroxidase [Thiotrichales bacterium HSG14]